MNLYPTLFVSDRGPGLSAIEKQMIPGGMDSNEAFNFAQLLAFASDVCNDAKTANRLQLKNRAEIDIIHNFFCLLIESNRESKHREKNPDCAGSEISFMHRKAIARLPSSWISVQKDDLQISVTSHAEEMQLSLK